MKDVRPERGTKCTCLNCETRFYDLARIPAICPKCGAEYVEVVRPAPVTYQGRSKGFFGKGRPSQPFEGEDREIPPADAPRSEDDDREPGEEGELELDGEAEPEAGGEDIEE